MAKLPTRTGTQVSTLDSDRHAMGLHGESIKVIMSMLSNLYTDPQEAVLREYSVNALDSHLEAGVIEPIIVNLPTTMRQYLTIQDFGLGLTTDEVIELFGLYGNSTKRNSDSVTGMLGVGSKSGLAYSNSFTVVAVKNGVQTTALVSKDDEGVGQIDIVDTCSTDKRNGVTIQIPVAMRDVSRFREIAENFFSYWAPGEYLLDGKTVSMAHLETGYVKAGNLNVYVGERSYNNNKVVVMGHVPYKVDSEILNDLLGRNSMIAYLNMGEVQFAPSREELMYSNMTNKTLSKLAEGISGQAQAAVDEIMAGCNSRTEAYAAKQKNAGFDLFAKYATWTYDGWAVPNKIVSLDCEGKYFSGYSYNGATDWNVNNATSGTRIPQYKNEEYLLVNNAPKSIPNWLKVAILEHYGTTGTTMYVNFCEGDVAADERYSFLPWVEWSEIQTNCPKPKGAAKSGGISVDRTSHNYEVIRFVSTNRWRAENMRREYTGQYIDDLGDDAYFIPALPGDNGLKWKEIQAYAASSDKDVHIVQVNKTKVKEFTESDYNVTNLAELKAEAVLRIASINKADVIAYIVTATRETWLGGLVALPNEPELLDPEVAGLVESFRKAKKQGAVVGTLTTMDYEAACARYKIEDAYWNHDKYATELLPDLKAVEARYNVLDLRYNRTDTGIVVETMNALYTYRLEN